MNNHHQNSETASDTAPDLEPKSSQAALGAATDWLVAFEGALTSDNVFTLAALFEKDGIWRDIVSVSWHLQTIIGAQEIAQAFVQGDVSTRPVELRIASERTPPRWVARAGTECLEALFAFETQVGRGSGVLRLVPSQETSGSLQAWTLITTLDELKGFEERTGERRPSGENYSRSFGGDNWLDMRQASASYADRDPAVIVVGGGQAGLAIAARLGQLDVDTLVVDRHERVGDNWRKRYHSLTLHNEVFANHLPYMPFPSTWPKYVPKDKVANWFESYADAMELNFWTGTELVNGRYDDERQRWTVTLRQRDGSERTMTPRHLVFATGANTRPHRPALPGLDTFAGTVTHSEGYVSGARWKGKKALVLGTGNSGHDTAHDLHASGAQVSLIQRGSSGIISLESAQLLYALYTEGPPIEDCDLLATSSPYPVLVRGFQLLTEQVKRRDKSTIDGLRARGFKIDFGDDQTGIQMQYFRRGGGYYIDVGCSDLIINGQLPLLQWDDIECFVAEGAKLRDGTVLAADLLVLATGYKGLSDLVRDLLGDSVADRVGPIWGFGQDGELRNMFARTGQDGLWFTAGSLAMSRIYSKFLALQIKACEEGMISLDAPAPASEISAAI
ncbi:MAG: cation diffusion facilitator CzcD-associated flavoprotein CzcO [Gammaproteobacteria bacterium]|jgi:cation diffusion facilitator CzcD-associated flavoprotein CzcO